MMQAAPSGSYRILRVVANAARAVAVAIAVSSVVSTTQAAVIGDAAPSFTLSGPQGAVSLDAVRARGEWTYLDFWASWCGPCKQSFPWMNEMHAKYGGKGGPKSKAKGRTAPKKAAAKKPAARKRTAAKA